MDILPSPISQNDSSGSGHPLRGFTPLPAVGGTLRTLPGEAIVPSRIARRPFQFATLRRLDDEVQRAMTYGKQVEGLRETTIRWWRDAYRLFRRFLLESNLEVMFLRGEPDAQARVLESWIAWSRSRGLLHGTIRAYWRAVLSLFDRFTVLDGVENPLRQFRLPRASAPLPRAISRDDAEHLLMFLRNSAGPRFRTARNLALVGCMLYAGLRRGEVIRLTLNDVHRGAQTIRIQRAKGRDGGKDRIAYIPSQLATLLAAYERAREARGDALTKPYFLHERRSEPITEGTIRRLFTTIREKTRLDVAPHRLRHTFVTLLRQAGVADRITMDLAGHASLAMVQRYSTVFSGEHLEAAEKLRLDVDL
jgi:site-specific recombinase XerD